MKPLVTKAPQAFLDAVNVPRTHALYGPWKKLPTGIRGAKDRRIIRERLVIAPDGKAYREYYHATKGLRMRRLTARAGAQ